MTVLITDWSSAFSFFPPRLPLSLKDSSSVFITAHSSSPALMNFQALCHRRSLLVWKPHRSLPQRTSKVSGCSPSSLHSKKFNGTKHAIHPLFYSRGASKLQSPPSLRLPSEETGSSSKTHFHLTVMTLKTAHKLHKNQCFSPSLIHNR